MDYTSIYNTYFKRLRYFASRILGDDDEAEDIAQESLVKVWQKLADFDNETSTKVYLYTVVRNACFNHLKKMNRLRKKEIDYEYIVEKSQDAIVGLMMKSELMQEIINEVEKLPTAEGNVFKLFFFEGMSTDDIAIKLGLSAKTVRNQKGRAISKMKLQFLKH